MRRMRYERDDSMYRAACIRQDRAVQNAGGMEAIIAPLVEKVVARYRELTAGLDAAGAVGAMRAAGGFSTLIIEAAGEAPESKPTSLGQEDNPAAIIHSLVTGPWSNEIRERAQLIISRKR